MPTFRIAVIPGDGVGIEVVAEGRKVLEALARRDRRLRCRFTTFSWGSAHYRKHGRMMPADGLDTLRKFDAIYLGAVGDPKVPDHVTLHGLLLPIRRGFDQYANVRPAVLYPGAPTPLANAAPGSIDMLVIRENTEGEYADVGGRLSRAFEDEVAVQTNVFTRRGTERIIRFAFEQARSRKKHLTSITKSNAMAHSMVFWDEVFQAVAGDFPDVKTSSMLVDAACMNFVRRPESFDVVVASNLFGDILTDLSAAVVGGMGLAPAANLNPTRRFPSMFEPVHGSAPDIAGKGIVNPIAAILTAGMMLDFLGARQAASRIGRAVAAVLAEKKTRTPDLGGRSKTQEVTAAILAHL
jgi:tartrate dehydrogenase/decarboxylase / D-malate dehydrogenase